MLQRTTMILLAAIASGAMVAPAQAEYCGPQPATFDVGNRFVGFGGPGSSGSPTHALVVQTLPVGSNSIVVAANPVDSGPNVIYSGSVEVGQRIDFRGHRGSFYVRIPGSGGRAGVLLCKN